MSELNDIGYELPDIKRALILAPHPDDETLGCGGTIALYSGKIVFTVIALSNGEAINLPEGNKADLRKKELRDAMEILGVRDIIFLNIPDGKFKEHRDEIKKKISEIFLLKEPQIVFSPSPLDLHPDHRETAMGCIELVEKFPSTKIAFYEIYNPIRFNTLIDISKVVETKKEALTKYHYSMLKKEDIFISSVLSLNRFRSLFTLKNSYYEAFWMPNAIQDIEDVISWFTCGITHSSPEDRLLGTIRVVDSLLHHMREVEEELKGKGGLIDDLTSKLNEKEEIIYGLQNQIRLIEASVFWKFARRFHRKKDRLLPEESLRRLLYERIICVLKNRLF